MSAKLVIEIDTGNAQFDAGTDHHMDQIYHRGEQCAKVLKSVQSQLTNGYVGGIVRDDCGHPIGNWSFKDG